MVRRPTSSHVCPQGGPVSGRQRRLLDVFRTTCSTSATTTYELPNDGRDRRKQRLYDDVFNVGYDDPSTTLGRPTQRRSWSTEERPVPWSPPTNSRGTACIDNSIKAMENSVQTSVQACKSAKHIMLAIIT
jgi:hypothetical protein